MPGPAQKKKKNIWLIAAAVLLTAAVIPALFLSACRSVELPEEQTEAAGAGSLAAAETETAGSETESERPAAGLNGAVIFTSEGVKAAGAFADHPELIDQWAEEDAPPQTEENESRTPRTGFFKKFGDAVEVTEDGSWQPDAELEELRRKYPDAVARIVIPGTVIEGPVFSSPSDDTRYLDRDRDGKVSSAGELFVEQSYNRIDFSDPVTVIYGHNMRSGKMFGYLQEYYQGVKDGISAGEAIKKYGTVEVFTPEGILSYRVFAAIPFDSRHILAGTDFTGSAAFVSFFAEIQKTRTLGGSVDRSVAVVPKDKVLILSTCMPDHDSRFLVFGRLTGAGTGGQTRDEE